MKQNFMPNMYILHLLSYLEVYRGSTKLIFFSWIEVCVQMPLQEFTKYASQLLNVIAPLMGDTEEEVIYAAVHGLSSVGI